MRAIVFSGGGSKIYFMLGAYAGLVSELMDGTPANNEEPLPHKAFVGVSAGAILAMALCGGTMHHLHEARRALWSIRGNKDVYRRRFLSRLRLVCGSSSLMDPWPLRKRLVEMNATPDAVANGNQFRAATVGLGSGDIRVITERTEDVLLPDMVLASSSISPYFPGIEHGGEVWVDGGYRDVNPLRHAIEMGAEQIDVILASPLRVAPFDVRIKSGLDRAIRGLEILTNETLVADLAQAAQRNQAVDGGVATKAGDRRIEIQVIAPQVPPTKLGTLQFDPDEYDPMYRMGFEAAGHPIPLESLL